MLITCVLSFLFVFSLCIFWFMDSVKDGTATRGEVVLYTVLTILSIVPILGMVIAGLIIITTCVALYEENKGSIESWFDQPVLRKKDDVQSSD